EAAGVFRPELVDLTARAGDDDTGARPAHGVDGRGPMGMDYTRRRIALPRAELSQSTRHVHTIWRSVCDIARTLQVRGPNTVRPIRSVVIDVYRSRVSVREMPEDGVLAVKAREAIRTGLLPAHAPDRTFGGSGSGAACAVCGELVRRRQGGFALEYDRNGPNPGLDRYELHPKCLKAWERERVNLA